MGPDQTVQAQIANLLSGAPIGVLRLRDGTLNLPTSTGSEAIKRIDARFRRKLGHRNDVELRLLRPARRDRGLRARLRRRRPRPRTEFAFRSISPSPRNPSRPRSRAPRPSTTVFSSRATCRPTWTTRGASCQVGRDQPCRRGRSLEKLSAAGKARSNGSTLTFDDGTFSLDGNKAVGLLAVTPGPRPRIDATLDFERLAIDPYLDGTDRPTHPDAQAGLLEGTLIKYFDADFAHLSAAEHFRPHDQARARRVPPFSTKDGVLTRRVGELDLAAARASGSVNVDLSRE